MVCDVCRSDVPAGLIACQACGYPQAGTREEKTYFINNYFAKSDDTDVAMKRFNGARAATYIFGGLMVLATAILAGQFNRLDILDTPEAMLVLAIAIGIAVLFFLLAALARMRPKPIMIVIALLMIVLAILDIVQDVNPLRLIVRIACFVPVARAIPHMDKVPPKQRKDPQVLDSVWDQEG